MHEDLDSLTPRVAELYRKGERAGATKVAEQLVETAERQFGKAVTEMATPISHLAEL